MADGPLVTYDRAMLRWLRRDRPNRAALIERKHELEGQIRLLATEVERLRNRDASTVHAESRLAHLRNLHYRTRQAIDRADP